MANSYDTIVIGSGPGGYVAAIRCAQLGMKTALVEKDKTLGGTCLNVGCIPSKALLNSSEHYHNLQHHFAEHGITASNVKVDLSKLIDRKNKVVKSTVAGIKFLMKKNKIDTYEGVGSFVNKNTVKVTPATGKAEELEAKNIIIATGSEVAILPGMELDGKRILSSTEMLDQRELPKHLIVVGAGVIGLELGSVFARLGSKVSVVEYAGSVLAGMDVDAHMEIQKILQKQLKFEYYFNHKVESIKSTKKEVNLTATDKDGKKVSLKGDYCLVATGRRPYTEGLNLEAAGIKLDDRGRIQTDATLQTTAAGVYAIGDVVKGAMLAHKASDEGVMVAETIAGQHSHINYLAIPGVVYTWQEVASVGHTEQELKENGTPYKSGKFPFMASGRAKAAADTDGFVKVLAHKETDEILGVHIVGARAADIIGEAVALMEFRASAEDAGIISHAHPTFTEALMEAALAATGNRAIHM